MSELETLSKLPPLIATSKDGLNTVASPTESLIEHLKIAAPFVERLVFKQLRCNEQDAEGTHIDMSIIFDNMPRLSELQIFYGYVSLEDTERKLII